jgi:hypothetical protein
MNTRKQKQRLNCGRAMTAVEVLAATVLASLMLGSVIGVLGGLARQQRALRMSLVAPPWHRQLADQLLWDLQNSREFVVSRDGVRLVGFAGRDFASGRPTGRPTVVEYYLLEADNDRFLVRREEQLDARTNENWRIEVVCRGARRFDVGTTSVDQAATDRPHLSRPEASVPLGERIAVRVYGADVDSPLFDQLFVLR